MSGPMTPLVNAGKCFRHHRKAKNLTALDVANAAGCSPQMLCDVEMGRRQPSPALGEWLLTAIGADLRVRSRVVNGWMARDLAVVEQWQKVRRG